MKTYFCRTIHRVTVYIHVCNKHDLLLLSDFVCCVNKVSELVNHLVMVLFGMSGTSTEMIT